MTIYKFIIFILNEAIFYLSLHLYFTGILDKVRIRKYTAVIYFVPILFGVLVYFYQLPSYVIVMTSFVLDFTISLNYSKKLSKNIPYTLLFILFVNFFESLTVFLISIIFSISLEETISNNFTYTISIFLCRFLLLLASYIIYMLKTKLNISKNTTHFWPVIAIFSMGSLYIFYFMLSLSVHGKISDYPEIILVLTVVILFSITVFHLYNRQCEDYELREENDRLSHYLNIQELQQTETLNYYKKISAIRHDMKNLFIGLSGLMRDKEYDKVCEIINDKAELFSVQENIVNTPDNVINTILNYKISYAHNYDIDVNCNLLLTNSINIGYDDLSIILGNAIDNGIEYLSSHDIMNKLLTIKITYDYNVLTIIITNPVCDNINIPPDYIIPSTKTGANHGYGISSIKKIIEKYNGMLLLTCENDIFSIDITLICEK